jgi:adenylyltransferase/sulfurtransferase
MSRNLSQDELFRYSRHLMLPEVGLAGQEKLKRSSALIVGTGGLGSPISLYLAAAGVGRLGLVDYDKVEISNLQRQIVHTTSTLGVAKVESAKRHLSDLNPTIEVIPFNTVLTSHNIDEIAGSFDVIVDGTDNLTTRYLLNDYAGLHNKPYVYGSIFRFEGQVSVFDVRKGACYRCLFPESPPPELLPPCSDAGVMGILPGIVGCMEANETIKLLLGIGEPLINRMVLFDALEMRFTEICLKKNPSCPLCGEHPAIQNLVDYEQFCGAPYQRTNQQESFSNNISPKELSELLKEKKDILLIDVRNTVEHQVSSLSGAIAIPLEMLSSQIQDISHDKPIVVFCRTGVRSQTAVGLMQKAGFTNVRSLQGGINAWVRQVDPSMSQY